MTLCRRSQLLIALVAAGAIVGGAACTGGTGGGRTGTAPTGSDVGQLKLLAELPRPDGTAFGRIGEALPPGTSGEGLLTILTASDRDAHGHPVGRANRFAPTAPQVAVLVHVGELPKPTTLKIDWYATDAAGKEYLLTERTIHVDGHEWAFSVGHAARPVDPGQYDAVARLGGSELATWFTVGDLDPPVTGSDATGASASGMAFAGAVTMGDQQGGGEWNTWDDGKVPDQPAPAPGGSPSTCHFHVSAQALAGYVEARAGPEVAEDDCGRVTLAAAVSGDPVEQSSGDNGAVKNIFPCDLPGGSDLPGTIVHITATAEHGGQTATATAELEDDGTPPAVTGVSSPPDGTKVRARQTISIHAAAVDMALGTGIRTVEGFANGRRFASWTSPNSEPEACDPSRFIRAVSITYRVPRHPPPIVEILVRAADYTGRFGWKTWHFPTQGTEWTGTATADLEQQVPSGDQIATAKMDVILLEDPDGNITGVLDGEQAQVLTLATCPSTTISAGHIHAEVSGTHHGDTVSLELGRIGFTPPDVTPCPGAGEPGKIGSLADPLFPPVGEALSAITKQDDGYKAEASGTYGNQYPYTVSFTIELKPSS